MSRKHNIGNSPRHGNRPTLPVSKRALPELAQPAATEPAAQPITKRRFRLNLLEAFTIATLLFYAVVFVFYEKFYSALQVSLSEVGLSYADILFRSSDILTLLLLAVLA